MNLIHVSDLNTNPILCAFVAGGGADFGNVLDTHCLVGLLLDFVDGRGAVEGPVDFLEGGTAGLDEEEVDGDELDDQPALEKEVELPASRGDANRNHKLRDGQADVGGKPLYEQAVGADLEGQDFERVGDVEGDPGK